MEMIRNFRWTAHNRGVPQFDVLIADGHVRATPRKGARDILAEFFANNQGGVSSGWTRFDRVLKAILVDAK
ncbi:MAG: hypothetical protein QM770_06990 [Tepidisphaeraceae bacterium]